MIIGLTVAIVTNSMSQSFKFCLKWRQVLNHCFTSELFLKFQVPTKEQVDTVTADLRSRSKVPGGNIMALLLTTTGMKVCIVSDLFF
jgi:hypothetical protein